METRNITLSLPKDTLRRVKIIAAERNTSVSRLLTDMLEALVRQSDAYALARERQLAIMKWGIDLGTRGRITWTRDELHER